MRGRSIVVTLLTLPALLLQNVPPANATPGDTAWIKVLDSPPGGGNESGARIVISPDGQTVYMLAAGETVRLFALAADTGGVLWSVERPDIHALNSFAPLAISPDGSQLFLAGGVLHPGWDLGVLALDSATGDVRWFTIHGRRRGIPRYSDDPRAIGVSQDGSRIFVTGTTFDFTRPAGAEYDYQTVAFSANSGRKLWVRHFAGPSDQDDHSEAIGIGRGRVFVTGWSDIGTAGLDENIVTIAYRASDGGPLWRSSYDERGGSSYQRGVSLAVGPNGHHLYVLGLSHVADTQVVLLALSARGGAELWRRHLRSADGDGWPGALAASPDGHAVVATGTTNNHFTTAVASATSGEWRWVRRYSGGDTVYGVAVSSDSRLVFAVGWNSGSIAATYGVSSGEERWVREYIGPGGKSHAATGVVANPDSSLVFVTGGSWEADDTLHPFVLAYKG